MYCSSARSWSTRASSRSCTADRCRSGLAERVESGFGLGRGRRQEGTAGRELAAWEFSQQRSVELIRPRPRDHVALAADRATILRRQDAFDDLPLGNRLDAQDLDLVLAAV